MAQHVLRPAMKERISIQKLPSITLWVLKHSSVLMKGHTPEMLIVSLAAQFSFQRFLFLAQLVTTFVPLSPFIERLALS